MKKKIYLTVLIVVTLICVIFGTMNHMGVFGRSNHVRYDTGKTPSEDGSAAFRGSESAGSKTKARKNPAAGDALFSEERSSSEVTELHADIEYGSLTVRTGEEFSAEYNGDSDLRPEVDLKNGVLTVAQKGRNFNFFKNLLHPKAELTVVLPKGTVLDEADIALDLGDAVLSGLTAENGTIVNNLGRIELSSCRLGSVKIEADMGDVVLEECGFRDLSVEEDLGAVRIRSAADLSGASVELETDLGKVLVNGSEQGTEYRASGSDGIRLSVHNDLGDVELEY